MQIKTSRYSSFFLGSKTDQKKLLNSNLSDQFLFYFGFFDDELESIFVDKLDRHSLPPITCSQSQLLVQLLPFLWPVRLPITSNPDDSVQSTHPMGLTASGKYRWQRYAVCDRSPGPSRQLQLQRLLPTHNYRPGR